MAICVLIMTLAVENHAQNAFTNIDAHNILCSPSI